MRHQFTDQIAPYSLSRIGQGEDFRTAEQVVQCVRPGVLLSAATIPSVRTTDASGQQVLLNRYVLDYWKHGQRRALQEANGMREGMCCHFAALCMTQRLAT